MKQFWCDVETTGTDPEKHGIWQIAYKIKVKDIVVAKSIKVKPFDEDVVDAKALAVGNISFDELRTFEEPVEVYKSIISDLSQFVDRFDKKDKFMFFGYNAMFDMDFLRSFFSHNGDKYFGSWFWFPPIDVMVVAANNMIDIRHTLENFKLHTVAKARGVRVKEDRLHDAQYDIELTEEIYKTLQTK